MRGTPVRDRSPRSKLRRGRVLASRHPEDRLARPTASSWSDRRAVVLGVPIRAASGPARRCCADGAPSRWHCRCWPWVGFAFGLQAALGRIGGGPLATADAPGGLQPAASRIWIVRAGRHPVVHCRERRAPKRRSPARRSAGGRSGQARLYPGERVAIPTGLTFRTDARGCPP